MLEAVAAAEAGVLRLALHPRNSGGHRVGEGEGIDVRAATLPELLAEGEVEQDEIGLIWMDAQGSEEAILEGAPELVGAVPAVVEVRPSDWRDLQGVLDAYAEAIDLRTGEAVDGGKVEPATYTDLLLVPARPSLGRFS